jgi:hypothetical protein
VRLPTVSIRASLYESYIMQCKHRATAGPCAVPVAEINNTSGLDGVSAPFYTLHQLNYLTSPSSQEKRSDTKIEPLALARGARRGGL